MHTHTHTPRVPPGEEVLPTVLSLWGRASAGVRDQMVVFLHCQLAIHHPLGRHTDDNGAWAHNEKTFNKNIERLSNILLEDFETSRLR